MPFYCVHLRPYSDVHLRLSYYVHLEPSNSAPHIHQVTLSVIMAVGFLILFHHISKQF